MIKMILTFFPHNPEALALDFVLEKKSASAFGESTSNKIQSAYWVTTEYYYSPNWTSQLAE